MRRALLLLWLLLLATPTWAAVATSKATLNAVAWTDLGAGPMLLTPSGNVVFAIGDATPTIPLKQGFTLKGNQTLNTTSHVWAMAVDVYLTTVFISPVAAKGGFSPASTWSATDATATSMTLSNGGLTVTQPAAVWKTIRNTVSKTSGKLYVEYLINAQSGFEFFGLGSAGINVLAQLGASNYGFGWYPTQGVQSDNAVGGFGIYYQYSGAYPAVNDVVALAVDFSTGNVWLAINNVWVNGSNPATGSLPIVAFTLATTGPIFVASTLGNSGDQWTLQSSAASQKYLPPPGFQAWDGGPVSPQLPHRYWRIYVVHTQDDGGTGGGADAAIAELQFRVTAGVPLLFSGGTASASDCYLGCGDGYSGAMAADNNAATFWASANTGSNPTWTYDYGAGNTKKIVEITMQSRPDGSYAQTPSSFTPQWSDNGSTWASMAMITATTWTGPGQIQTFAVTP